MSGHQYSSAVVMDLDGTGLGDGVAYAVHRRARQARDIDPPCAHDIDPLLIHQPIGLHGIKSGVRKHPLLIGQESEIFSS